MVEEFISIGFWLGYVSPDGIKIAALSKFYWYKTLTNLEACFARANL